MWARDSRVVAMSTVYHLREETTQIGRGDLFLGFETHVVEAPAGSTVLTHRLWQTGLEAVVL